MLIPNQHACRVAWVAHSGCRHQPVPLESPFWLQAPIRCLRPEIERRQLVL